MHASICFFRCYCNATPAAHKLFRPRTTACQLTCRATSPTGTSQSTGFSATSRASSAAPSRPSFALAPLLPCTGRAWAATARLTSTASCVAICRRWQPRLAVKRTSTVRRAGVVRQRRAEAEWRHDSNICLCLAHNPCEAIWASNRGVDSCSAICNHSLVNVVRVLSLRSPLCRRPPLRRGLQPLRLPGGRGAHGPPYRHQGACTAAMCYRVWAVSCSIVRYGVA